MRKFAWIFIVLLGIRGPAEAQPSVESKQWEVSGSAAIFEVRPHADDADAYGDDWYFSGRYSLMVGHYWTEHLKTEVEYAISGEGSTYLQRFGSAPGNPAPYPYSVESLHRIEQGSVRMVWQFANNAWVHPYVSGGLVVDRDRLRVRTPALYQYPPGRTSGPMIYVPEVTTEPTTAYRVGVATSAGAKIYFTQNAFFNAGALATYAKPVTTITLLAGFGIDF